MVCWMHMPGIRGADAMAWGIEANEVNSAPIGMREPEKPAVDAVAVRGWVSSSVETVAGTVNHFRENGVDPAVNGDLTAGISRVLCHVLQGGDHGRPDEGEQRDRYDDLHQQESSDSPIA